MNGLIIMIIAIVVLLAAYLLYGRYLAKTWGIDPKAKTPAYELEDGVDYVPADTNVVFGHQFASIAGAAAINGPIQASGFGWLPVLLWILLGGVFFGAVQDFAAMYASVKNKGRTIGYIIESYIGKTGKKLFLLFCWLFSILVVAAFVDIVAGTFNGFQTAADGVMTPVPANGSVATTSMIFIVEAILLGLLLRYGKRNKWVNTAIALVMLVAAIVLGLQFPLYIGLNQWHILVFIYVLIASVAPIWILLQPRDYLNSYLLIAMIVAAVVGVLVARPAVNLPVFSGFVVGGQSLFPFLFVTIACGAVSGFHSLVSSGTASKQIKNERSMLPVSFGAMLMESMLAVIALIAVASFSSSAETAALGYATPTQIFAGGVTNFLAVLGLPQDVVFTLINLSVSAFALTSLDSVARVGRLSFQELFQDDSIGAQDMSLLRRVLTNKYFATVLTLVLAYLLTQAGYDSIWPLFGASNQLLSALAFLACAVFLKRTKRKNFMLWVPLFTMAAVTFTALGITIGKLVAGITDGTYQWVAGMTTTVDGASVLTAWGAGLQLIFAVLILALGVVVVVQGVRKLLEKVPAEQSV
ncbi:carbon starvation protein A [Pseudoflavonifractor phocaeensis]|uniref:carbon starvation CstA family protein n=1 Tax=Pseudoflavonifractor phocaeensis TaxID=1870988 RepID=UPI001957CB34|nr:carbon starvation CstA family protein [Pseudoflavonifractor phocaeensis]MBM6925061.1 carbon starvation protein A [Pseudoflavonifractor phocaeensis]